MNGKAVNWSELGIKMPSLNRIWHGFRRYAGVQERKGMVTPGCCLINHIEVIMKSLLSISLRCLNALLWSLGLSSVVLVLMLGFYLCWTMPLTKDEPANLADKPQKAKIETKAVIVTLDNNSVFADR